MPSAMSLTATDQMETAIQRFNAMQGKLRISVTHDCQLRCRFCHREGIDRHWVATHMSLVFLERVTRTYARMGGRFVELTGGEPTLHPGIAEVIERAAKHGSALILCTNGLRLDRVQRQLDRGLIHQIKLSLHQGSNGSEATWLLGREWDCERIRSNMGAVLRSKTPVQLIYTHTRHNSSDLRRVLRLALEWNADMQLVDLITTRVRDNGKALGYVSGNETERVVAEFARLDRIDSDRTGAVLKVYRTPSGHEWEIKDYHYGLFHSHMCDGCEKKTDCGEGVYALRVDALGVFKPCLLRRDLESKLNPNTCTEADLALQMNRMLKTMLSSDESARGVLAVSDRELARPQRRYVPIYSY